MALVRPNYRQVTDGDTALIRTACNGDYEAVYVLDRSLEKAEGVTETLLEGLRRVYDIVSEVKPMLNVVPLVEAAGWTTSEVAKLKDVEVLISGNHSEAEDRNFLQQLNLLRGKENLKSVEMRGIEETVDSAHSVWGAVEGRLKEDPLFFDYVCLGGTYDRLHAGHRLLLATAALITCRDLTIGVTSDQYLLRKEYKDRIEPLEMRIQKVLEFVKHVRPCIQVTLSVLKDPNEPTLAETNPCMQAIVVSKETIKGGEAINASRKQRGFSPLALITVGLVGESEGKKLSSTHLRKHVEENHASPDQL